MIVKDTDGAVDYPRDEEYEHRMSLNDSRTGLPHPAHHYDVKKVAFAVGKMGGSTPLRYDTEKSNGRMWG
jgi:hypothetical protein